IPVAVAAVVRSIHSRILIAGLSAVILACRADEPRKAPPRAPDSVASATAQSDTTRARRDTFEAGGDVALDSNADSAGARPREIWLNDANVLSLFATYNDRQVAAADIEL